MTDRATQYAERVVGGGEVAGRPHVLACKRHLRDLERQDTPDFPYHWRSERSEEILDFAEALTILEGARPQPVKLYGCQAFDLGVPMGWVNREGFRRFRRKYKSVARQNGKTFENGITAAYLAAFGGYRYGKLFTVATKRRQAALAWEEAAKFIKADADLAEWFLIKAYKSLIECPETGCTIEALSREGGLDEGFRSIYASLDEIHQHRDNSIYSAIYKGQRSLTEALLSMITTRGRNLNSFCYEFDRYCLGVLEGAYTAEDLFADIYTLDKNDGIYDPAHFLKSNPVLCRTEHGMKTMLTDARTAQDMGGDDLMEYMVKCQNLWAQDVELMFTTAEILEKCRKRMPLDRLRGKSCYAGLDLSSGGDLTTLALEFEELGEDGLPWYYGWSHSFMPRGRMMEHIRSDIAPYDLWERKELITVTGGESDYKNDYKFIISELRTVLAEYGLTLLGIGYDPHNADVFLADLEAFGVPLLEAKQSARALNDATQEIKLLMKSGKYFYDADNELLDMSFRNARIVKNSFGEEKVDKEPNSRTRRIDPVDAAINAHLARMKLREGPAVDTEKLLAAYLEKMGWNKS